MATYPALDCASGAGFIAFGNSGYGTGARWRIAWYKHTTIANFGGLWEKTQNYVQSRSTGAIEWTVLGAGNAFARSATGVLVTGTWQCVLVTLNASGVPRIYVGDESTPLAEVSYATQTTGSSPNSDATQALRLGKSGGGFNGSFGPCAAGAGEIDLGEAEAWRQNPTLAITGEGGRWLPGADGTSTVEDLTANNRDGSVSGTLTSGTGPTLPDPAADPDFLFSRRRDARRRR